MTINEIDAEWKRDSVIERDALDEAALKTPILHGKYLELLIDARTRLRAERLKLAKLKHLLGQYYRGELNNPDDLREIGREPWAKKILRQDAQEYVEADPQFQEVSQRIIILEGKVDALSLIMDQINKRGFHIKNAIDFMRLMNGDY